MDFEKFFDEVQHDVLQPLFNRDEVEEDVENIIIPAYNYMLRNKVDGGTDKYHVLYNVRDNKDVALAISEGGLGAVEIAQIVKTLSEGGTGYFIVDNNVAKCVTIREIAMLTGMTILHRIIGMAMIAPTDSSELAKFHEKFIRKRLESVLL